MVRIREDRGFTLTELIVVMGLLGVVLTIVYSAAFALIQGARVSDQRAAFTREIAEPLLAIDRIIVQNIYIEYADEYKIAVLTDRDMNNKVERVTIEALPGPGGARLGTLRMLVEELNPSRTTVERVIQDWTMSESNVNVADGVPLFEYYGTHPYTDLMVFPGDAGTISSDSRSLIVTITAEHNDRVIEDSRRIYFRLRQW